MSRSRDDDRADGGGPEPFEDSTATDIDHRATAAASPGPAQLQAISTPRPLKRPPILEAGSRLGTYTVEALLAAGSMGAVYRCTDRDGQTVAVKLLATLAEEPELVRRFDREARMLSRIRHDNVVRVVDWGVLPDGRAYLTMELLEGETLEERLRRGPASLQETVDVMIQAARGLEACHAEGIVHRDLKPANLLLCKRQGRPRVRLLDFGLARAVGSGKEHETKLTRAGMTLGTPLYMAPEQVRTSEVDWRADVYSLGVIGYELLSGRPPFTGSTPELLSQHLEREPEPLSRRVAVPRAVEALLLSMLAKRPTDRPALPRVRRRLERWRVRGVHPMLRTAASLLLGAALGLAGYWAWTEYLEQHDEAAPAASPMPLL